MRKSKLDRRSFLTQVVGGTVGGSALLVLGSGGAATPPREIGQRRMAVDADPSDPAREPPADGPPAPPPTPPRPGADSDAGPNSDPTGRGRGSSGQVGGIGQPQPSPAPRQSFVICPGHPRCPQ